MWGLQLSLRAALEQAYEAGSYRDRIAYQSPCEPPLSAEDRAWADDLIRTVEVAR